MKPLRRFVIATLLVAPASLLAPATSASAQEDVMRDVYGFFGSALDVDVASEAPGRIRLIRGRSSRIEVAGRSPDGFTSAALGGRGVRRLTLTAFGSEPVDFIVVVPEQVRVRINWQGETRSELFGTLARTATYAWRTPEDRPAIETVRPGAGRAGDAAHARAAATAATPRTVDITRAHRLERLTVRIEGSRFAVSADGSLDQRRDGDHLGLTARPGGDLAIFVPEGQSMSVRLDGHEAIAIDGPDVRVLCDAILSQVLPDGRRWLTIAPVPRDGCALPQRPGGTASPAGARRT